MKAILFRSSLLALTLGAAPLAGAATIIQTNNTGGAIPDGSSTGLGQVIQIAGSGESVVSVTLSLQIEAAAGEEAFLGDLYIYLTNGTDKVVLMNRAGRTASAPGGYGVNQSINVTFSSVGTRDNHNYPLGVGGTASTLLTGALTGDWQPDGRDIDPALVLDTDTRTGFEVFEDALADGTWGLYIADLSSGGEHSLISWTLTLETVPEPSSVLLGFAALPLLMRRRRQA